MRLIYRIFIKNIQIAKNLHRIVFNLYLFFFQKISKVYMDYTLKIL
jgi:hypothetical protein